MINPGRQLKNKQMFAIGIMFVCLFSFVEVSTAGCECELQTYEQAISRSDTIFVGNVIAVEETTQGGANGVLATFQVMTAYKNADQPEIKVFLKKDSCQSSKRIEFKQNTGYLVYSRADGPGQQSIEDCSRTAIIPDAMTDIALLNVKSTGQE